MKLSDNGTSTVTVDFGTIGKITADTSRYPHAVKQYLMVRGLRKLLSDQGAGFTGTDKELLDAITKVDSRLVQGKFRTNGDRGISAEELADIFRKMAPELTDEQMDERLQAFHPDFATDKKDEAARRKKVRDLAKAYKALQF